MHQYSKDNRDLAAMADLGTNPSARREALMTLADLRPLSEKVEIWMRVLGYPGKDLFAVRLALEEAIVNAFRHGTRGAPDKAVRVRYLVTQSEVVIEVEDDGPGFDPQLVPDPLMGELSSRMSGRGLFLMRVYMSAINYNREGNRVTLCRFRSPT
jgi:serine/threonine-protein kinase RsbW